MKTRVTARIPLCSSSGDCPELLVLEGGDLLVRGYSDGAELLQQVDGSVPGDESAVRIPASMVGTLRQSLRQVDIPSP